MISVVIPNYNGKKYLENCIRSLVASDFKEFEIIVVDNNSEDGSIDYLEKNFPEVKIVMIDHNSGFSYAVNRGIEHSKYPYVFLLNNDTIIDYKALGYLYKRISENENCFSVSSKMIQYYKSHLIDDAGDFYSIFGIAVKRGWNSPIKKYLKYDSIFSSCAGAAIYRKNIFDKIGYFDETFFAYMEDVDIGYRAKTYGYDNFYEPDAEVKHIVSGTLGIKKNAFKTKLSARNNVYVIYKNMPLWQIVINMPFLIFGFMMKWLMFCKNGFGSIFFTETFKAIKTCRKEVKVERKRGRAVNYIKIEFELIKGGYYLIKNTILKIIG